MTSAGTIVHVIDAVFIIGLSYVKPSINLFLVQVYLLIGMMMSVVLIIIY